MKSELTDLFLREYSSAEATRMYSRGTAGSGIEYLLDHDYRRVYAEALSRVPPASVRSGLRLLEFGCGAGMNLIWLVSWLSREGVRVEQAVGTDFSPVLIEAARNEARSYLDEIQRHGVAFHVARNERLIEDLSKVGGSDAARLRSSFHVAVGVNTIRYCHRTDTQLQCTRDLFHLLVPGGVCVVIDMNDRFPFFRSRWKNRLTGGSLADVEHHLPSLEDHAAAFAAVGFEVLRTARFCWIPHSAGPLLCGVLRSCAPILNAFAPSRAMRSLVIARKPTTPVDSRVRLS